MNDSRVVTRSLERKKGVDVYDSLFLLILQSCVHADSGKIYDNRKGEPKVKLIDWGPILVNPDLTGRLSKLEKEKQTNIKSLLNETRTSFDPFRQPRKRNLSLYVKMRLLICQPTTWLGRGGMGEYLREKKNDDLCHLVNREQEMARYLSIKRIGVTLRFPAFRDKHRSTGENIFRSSCCRTAGIEHQSKVSMIVVCSITAVMCLLKSRKIVNNPTPVSGGLTLCLCAIIVPLPLASFLFI
ncbi:hypothetical protein V8F33_006774 [Rhypophila sp. PSN 637]